MSNIYGIDTTKRVTALMIRDAIVECFYNAHCSQTGVSEDKMMTKMYCVQIVQKAFKETGGDYENPTKDSILAVIGWLAEFSKSFRDQELIAKHIGEIQKLIEILKE